MEQDKISSNVKLDFNFEEFYKLDKIIDVATELKSYSEKLNNYLSTYLDSMLNTIEEVESYMTDESWRKINEIFSFDDEQDKELIKNTSISDKLEVLFFYENDLFYLTNDKFAFGSKVNEFIDSMYILRKNETLFSDFILHYLYRKKKGQLYSIWRQTKQTDDFPRVSNEFAPCPNIKYSSYRKNDGGDFSLISNYNNDMSEFIISKDNILKNMRVHTKARIKTELQQYIGLNGRNAHRFKKYIS